MLGIFGVIVLVLGGFAAGGGIFEWPFLFTDGYREYTWVRSAGREGARGMLVLMGGILVVVGFVAQVVDAAARARLDSGRGLGPGRFAQATDEGPSTDGAAPDAETFDRTSKSATPLTTKPAGVQMSDVAESKKEKSRQPFKLPTATASVADSASWPTTDDVPAWQPLTIYNPEVAPEGGDTLITLQYRFEGDRQPVPGGHYLWVIDVSGDVTEIEYDAEAMQSEGQLTHIVRMPLAQSGFAGRWSTYLVLELDGRRQVVSNRWEFAPGEEARSIPLPAPTR